MPPLGRENFGGSLRVAKISRSHRPALAPPGVARRSPPTRIGRPEVKTNQCFSQNGAQRSSFRGTPKVADRRAGVTFPPAGCSRGTPTDHRRGYRCGVASLLARVRCGGAHVRGRAGSRRSRRAVWRRRYLPTLCYRTSATSCIPIRESRPGTLWQSPPRVPTSL